MSGLINHHTYCVCGDENLRERISYEAMSIVGKLKLNKLIFLHDSNDFRLDSAAKDVNIKSIKMQIEAQNWNYLTCLNQLDANTYSKRNIKIEIFPIDISENFDRLENREKALNYVNYVNKPDFHK